MRAKLAILLSGSGSTYANLAEACCDGRLQAEIVVVIGSKPELGGLLKARAFGHPTVVASAADDITAALRAHAAEWVAMCGWLRFWDPPSDFAGRAVNMHPSLLPDFGGKGMYGLRVHQAVLAAGVRESGCTAHLVAGDYDRGPILAQSRVSVAPTDTADTLQARVQGAERELYPRVLAELFASHSHPPPLGARPA
jgi:phosphoribosylglycinamide formyltransferase-1